MLYKEPIRINKEGCVVYNDWRLPTLGEAVSWLESDKKNGLLIDPIIDKGQSSNGLVTATVRLLPGSGSWGNYGDSYICPVCANKLIRYV